MTSEANKVFVFQPHRLRLTKLLIMLLCTMNGTCHVSSFAPGFFDSRRSECPALLSVDTGATGDDNVETSSLQFVAGTSFRTESAPLPTPPLQLVEFFQISEYRNHMLLGPGIPDGEVLPAVEPLLQPSPEIWDRWFKEADLTGTPTPRPNVDEILLVKSSGIPFPLGLTMFVESIVGVSLVLPEESESSFPEYQFTLIKDTIRAEGPRAIVWIYEKITGASSGQKEGQATHSFSTLKVESSTDKPGEIVFQSDVRIEVNVYFPKILLLILPMSREKSNALGSESTQKTLGEGASLKTFEKSYRKWLEQNGDGRQTEFSPTSSFIEEI
jgi:hypothetical protein